MCLKFTFLGDPIKKFLVVNLWSDVSRSSWDAAVDPGFLKGGFNKGYILSTPTLIKPTLVKPTLIKPTLVKPTLIKPTLVKTTLIKPCPFCAIRAHNCCLRLPGKCVILRHMFWVQSNVLVLNQVSLKSFIS